MGKRFSRYKFARRVAEGGATAGSALDEYIKFASGEKKVTYTRAETSKPQGQTLIYVNSFLNPGTATQFSQTTMSTRAFDKLNTLIDSVGKFHHQTFNESTNVILLGLGSWEPAKAIIRTGGAGSTSETSKITGERYTKRTGSESHTVPFGHDGTKTYFEVASEINQGVEDTNVNYTVSFNPERILRL